MSDIVVITRIMVKFNARGTGYYPPFIILFFTRAILFVLNGINEFVPDVAISLRLSAPVPLLQ